MLVVFAVVSVGASLFFIQQFSGINAVVFFSTAVFRGAGIKSDVAASALVALSNVIGVCPFPMLLLSSLHFVIISLSNEVLFCRFDSGLISDGQERTQVFTHHQLRRHGMFNVYKHRTFFDHPMALKGSWMCAGCCDACTSNESGMASTKDILSHPGRPRHRLVSLPALHFITKDEAESSNDCLLPLCVGTCWRSHME